MKPRKTWILIADGNSAKLLEHRGPGRGLMELPGRVWTAPAQRDFSDMPGRSFSRASPRRSKMEPSRKAASHQDGFAKTLIADLGDAHRKQEFESLILCAPPSMLGSLRKQMDGQLKPSIRAEIAKDLMQVALPDLPAHFSDVLAV